MNEQIRLNPWERLGTGVAHTNSALEAMTEAGLAGWNVRKVPLQAIDGRRRVDVTRDVGVIRDDPKTGKLVSMSVVGANYHIIQNEDHAALLDKIAARSGAVYDCAGMMSEGRKVFISMLLPNQTMVGGVDQVDNYIAAVNGHDGTMAFHFMTTPIRFKCANMLNVGLERSTSSFRVRHSAGAEVHMEARAMEALGHSEEYLQEFNARAEKMIQAPLSQSRFEQIVRKEFGADPDAPQYTKTRSDNKIAKMIELFVEAETNAEIRNTVWAGFNAITEWSDHFSHTRRQERGVALAQKAIADPAVKSTAMALMMKQIR